MQNWVLPKKYPILPTTIKNWVLPTQYPPLLILPLKPINKAPQTPYNFISNNANWVLPKKYPILSATIKNGYYPRQYPPLFILTF